MEKLEWINHSGEFHDSFDEDNEGAEWLEDNRVFFIILIYLDELNKKITKIVET